MKSIGKNHKAPGKAFPKLNILKLLSNKEDISEVMIVKEMQGIIIDLNLAFRKKRKLLHFFSLNKSPDSKKNIGT